MGKQNQNKKIKLFCIPYSGGSATTYLKWKDSVSSDVEIVPIELSGRGKRIYDPLYDNLNEAAEDVANYILSKYNRGDIYAIYGHSLGSLIAYETYYRLIEKIEQPPCHVFFSGRRAPQVIGEKTEYYKLPDDEFVDIVADYGGTTKQVMENSELRSMFLPILRSDFKIAETYQWEEKKEKMKSDITILNGTLDYSVQPYNMEDWEYCCDKNTNILEVKGGHFFLFEATNYITNILSNILFRYVGMNE